MIGGKKIDLRVLHQVSGVVRPGEMVAILGPSGAGKSTLLDVLAGRKTSGVISGIVRFNGEKRTPSMRRQLGYVEQQDVLLGTLTVRQMLMYTAMLKMDQSISKKQKEAEVHPSHRTFTHSHIRTFIHIHICACMCV
jgi:ABC-type multidrug transport system ATPase subunit